MRSVTFKVEKEIRQTRPLLCALMSLLFIGGFQSGLNAQNWRFATTEYLTGAVNENNLVLVGGRRGSLFRITDTLVNGLPDHRVEIVELSTYQDIFAVHFVDNDVAVAGLGGGILLRSVDQGETWKQSVLGDSLPIIGFTHKGSELLAYSRRQLFASTDGGATWGPGEILDKEVQQLVFLDDSTGFAVLSTGVVSATSNGGLDWQDAIGAPRNPIRSMAFGNSGFAVAVGDSSVVYTSQNRGRSWELSSVPERQVEFKTVNIGPDGRIIIAGQIPSGAKNSTGIQISDDNGDSWRNFTLGNSYNLLRINDILELKDGRYIVSCNQGRLYTVDPGLTALYTISESFYFYDQFGGGVNNAQPAANDRGEILVDKSGQALRSTNNGITWIVKTIRPEPLVGFQSFNNGEFLAANGRRLEDIMVSSNGGRDWSVYGTQSHPQLSNTLGRILFDFQTYDSGIALLAVGINDDQQGYFFTSDDHGRNYSGELVEGITTWTAHHFPEPQIGLAAGLESDRNFDTSEAARYHGIILKTENRGESWRPVFRANGDFGFPVSVVMLGDREYLAGVDGEAFGGEDRYAIVRTMDGGENWTKVAGAPSVVSDITQFSDSVLYAVGWMGLILRSNDRGQTWDRYEFDVPPIDTIRQGAVTFPSPINFSQVLLSPDRRTAIIVGNSAILRTQFDEPFPAITDNIGAVKPEEETGIAMTAFPNPTTNTATILFRENDVVRKGRVLLYDLGGRRVGAWDLDHTKELTIPTTSLVKGRYTVVLTDERGVVRGITDLIVQ